MLLYPDFVDEVLQRPLDLLGLFGGLLLLLLQLADDLLHLQQLTLGLLHLDDHLVPVNQNLTH